jgi:hypothetical protein
MNINEFAKMLDGRDYGYEMDTQEENEALHLGFVVVYGYSDDGAELKGVIDDEVFCFEGGEIWLDKNGLFEECEYECKYSNKVKENCKLIKIIWHNKGATSWTYKTDIPHAKFSIMEDGNVYCRGIVFDINNLG